MERCVVIFAIVAVAMFAVTGCSGDGQVDVQGQVTLDGKPLSLGSVSFFPADGKGPSAAAVLQEDGRYTVRVAPGRKRVEVLGYKIVGKKRHTEEDPTSPMVDITEPIVPERYNAKSELSCEVTAGRNDFNFELKTP